LIHAEQQKHFGRFAVGVSALLLMTDPVPALAERDLKVEEIVVVGTRWPRPVQDVAATVDVVTRADLLSSLATRGADIVRYTPGVSVAGAGTRFGDAEFSIRGLAGNRVLTLIDGVPLADQFDIGDFSNATQDYVVPDAISRVEILRGPASTLFGSDALGGVVAVLTRDPEEMLRESPLHADASALYSGADDSRVLSTSVAARGGSTTGALFLTRLDGHELDHAAKGREDPLDRERKAALVKVHHTLANGHRLRLRGDTFEESVEADLTTVLGWGRRYATTTSLVADDHRERFSVGAGYDFSGEPIDDARIDVFFASTRVEQVTREVRDIANPPVALHREFDYEQDSSGLSLGFEHRFDAGGVGHRLGWGVDMRRRTVEEYRYGVETNLATGSTTNVLLGEVMPVRDFPRSTVDEAGVYLHDEIELGRLSLIPGLRFDDYSMSADADAMYREDNPSTPVVDVDERALSPKLGVLYRASDGISLFAQYAHGFRAPPFEDVNIGFDIPRFNYRAIPNPDLRPETSDGVELGVRFTTDAVRASVAVFGADYDDLIETRVNLGIDPDSGALIFQSRNVARARVYGAEFKIEALLDRWLDGLSASLAANLTRGENRATDEPLNSVDPAEAILGLRFAPSEALSFSLLSTFVGAQDRVDETTVDLFTPGRFTNVDAFATWRPRPSLRIDVGVFNVFDASYWRWSAVRGRPEGDPMIDALSAPGRYGSVALHVSL
jgi:hemoglobin/transferrin/lactoferrin receptor protein